MPLLSQWYQSDVSILGPMGNGPTKYMVSLANGSGKNVWDTVVKSVTLTIQGHAMHLDFQVMHITRVDVILGQEWLYNLGPSLPRSYIDNSLEFEANGLKMRLQGE